MKISVVLPVKNQTAKLVGNLKSKVLPYYDSLGIDYEILIVSDGSDEPNQNAMILAMQTMPKQVKLVSYENHKGKGHNVQRGFLAASGDYVMFMDADMATDLHTLEKILPEIDLYDGFIASRHCPGAHILSKQTLTRRLISWTSRKMIKDRFHFANIHDTQCGYKLFRGDVAKILAKKQHDDGFAFDVEYLYLMQLNGLSVKEVPCNWTDDPDSSIGHPLKTSLAFYKEMGQIKKAKESYRLSPEEIEHLHAKPALEKNGLEANVKKKETEHVN
jgi:dolichyl-phosphate beta-glucosyltransferase